MHSFRRAKLYLPHSGQTQSPPAALCRGAPFLPNGAVALQARQCVLRAKLWAPQLQYQSPRMNGCRRSGDGETADAFDEGAGDRSRGRTSPQCMHAVREALLKVLHPAHIHTPSAGSTGE